MEFKITKTWNGLEIDHAPVVISLQCEEGKGLRVNVQAPFFNSPPAPNSPAGQPCDRLWDYEGLTKKKKKTSVKLSITFT